MIDDKIITEFIPAKIIEYPENTYPEATFEDKLINAISNLLFKDKEYRPRLLIINQYFDPQRMGYDVIARII
jgi:hypothetical protein